MKTIFFFFSLILVLNTVKAQIKALTENGKEVLLFDNGSWKYSQDSSNESTNANDSILVNPAKFSRPAGASFLVKSNVFNVGVYIDPAKWTFSRHKDNEVNPEYRFNSKSEGGYVIMVTEKTPIDLQNMPNIALINAEHASADAKIRSVEYRMVNNKKMLCLQIKGTIQGIKFAYLGYYYSNENGTIQLLSYTTQKLFESSKKGLESFLNGLIEIEK